MSYWWRSSRFLIISMLIDVIARSLFHCIVDVTTITATVVQLLSLSQCLLHCLSVAVFHCSHWIHVLIGLDIAPTFSLYHCRSTGLIVIVLPLTLLSPSHELLNVIVLQRQVFELLPFHLIVRARRPARGSVSLHKTLVNKIALRVCAWWKSSSAKCFELLPFHLTVRARRPARAVCLYTKRSSNK